MRFVIRVAFVMFLSVGNAYAQSVAVAGDSQSDAYRANDARCRNTVWANTTLNWVEQIARYRAGVVSLGSWGTFSEPRRTDYSQNWARSGAVSTDVNTKGQASGVAAQHTDAAILWVGPNDIDPANKQRAREVYYGTISPSTYTSWVNGIVNAQRLSARTMKTGGAVVWVATLAPSSRPRPGYTDPAGLARLTQAARDIAAGVRNGAPIDGYQVIDFEFGFMPWLVARGTAQPDGTWRVNGRSVAMTASCAPTSAMLPDGHSGSVFNGLWAAYILQVTGLATPFTDAEIAAASGL
jgi:hypothetical protein